MTTPLNILLVDDKPENLLALEVILKEPDRQLYRALSGNEALRLLLKHDFALVLLDVEMPEMDGYETAQLMRSQKRTRTVPIIFVTAGDRSEQRTFRGYEVGAVDFLQKPINTHILKSKVAIFAELHRKTEDLKALNGVLERTSQSLSEKVADLENVNRTLSHDLRAPLRSIHAFSEVLADNLKGKLEPESEDALGRILRASARMGRMLDDLFGLLRVSAADGVLSEIEAETVLAEVLESLRTDLQQSGAEVTHGSLPRVLAHPTLLAQIFQNLLANAIKYAGGKAPRVHIDAEPSENGGVRFCVRDHGVGIEPAARDRVFALFSRVGDTSAVAGAGVGLALCKRAVEKLGGKIWVESTYGEGSSFCFTVKGVEPKTEPSEAPAVTEAAGPEA
jgi:two-component system, sensor histidine kinase and response regulator